MTLVQKPPLRSWLPVALCALAGAVVFQCFGNATRGYIDTASLFYWWGAQWFDPASELTHGPMIVAVAAWLLGRNLRQGGQGSGSGVMGDGRGAGVAVMMGALGLHVVGYALQQTRLSAVAWLIFMGGLAAFAGGRRWARASVFPLGLLVLTLPFGFLDTLGVGFQLRLAVSAAVKGLAHLVGVGISRQGTQLFAADGLYQYDVAAACSGVRSMTALCAVALVAGYLNFQKLGVRAFLVAVCVPYVFAANVVRVAGIVLVGEWRGHAAAEWVHAWSGWAVFVGVACALLATAEIGRRRGMRKGEVMGDGLKVMGGVETDGRRAGAGGERGRCVSLWQGVMWVAAGSVLVALCTVKLDARSSKGKAGVKLTLEGRDPVELPSALGWRWVGVPAEVTAVERDLLPADTGYSRKTYVRRERTQERVAFSVVLSGQDRSSIHRPELCLVGQGWRLGQRQLRTLQLADGSGVEVSAWPIEKEILGADGRLMRVPALLVYWFSGGEDVVATHGAMLWRGWVDQVRHLRADRWAYVTVQTLAEDGDEAAWARVTEVAAEIWPQIRSEVSGATRVRDAADKKD